MTRYLCFIIFAITACLQPVSAEHFVILHTNDTHSMIDPDYDNLGGVVRRKVLFDSIRAKEPNVITIDAGDVVQGTPYFSLFKGDVEYAVMDSLKYDIMILGNHEFDNGMNDIAKYYATTKASKLSANYDFTGTPLQGLFSPYKIINIGSKKIAFIAVNLRPDGIIAASNYAGLKYTDPIGMVDSIAGELKSKQNVDAVVAVTHIGYSVTGNPVDDKHLIESSHNIDLLIGGHSHTEINPAKEKSPAYQFANADGRMITVCQTGSSGKNVGYIDVDIDGTQVKTVSKLIPVNSTLDYSADTNLVKFIAPYKHIVDSIMNRTIAISDIELPRGSVGAMNWAADLTYAIGTRVTGKKIDLAISNRGGMRRNLPKGEVSEGLIGAMFPFDNKLTLLRITGKDLKAALSVMASRGGDAVSSQVAVVYDGDGNIVKATINGKSIKDKKKYTLITIDYLANGGDYMTPLKNAEVLFLDTQKVGDIIAEEISNMGKAGKHITASTENRMVKQ